MNEQLQQRMELVAKAKALVEEIQTTHGKHTYENYCEYEDTRVCAAFLLDRLRDYDKPTIYRGWIGEWLQLSFANKVTGWSEDLTMETKEFSKKLVKIKENQECNIQTLFNCHAHFEEMVNHLSNLNAQADSIKINMNSAYGQVPEATEQYNKAEHESVFDKLDAGTSKEILNVIRDDRKKERESWREELLTQADQIRTELGDKYDEYLKLSDSLNSHNYVGFFFFRSYTSNRLLTQEIINKLAHPENRKLLQPYFAYRIGKVQAILHQKEKELKAQVREFGKHSPALQARFDKEDEMDRQQRERFVLNNTMSGAYAGATNVATTMVSAFITARRHLRQMAVAEGIHPVDDEAINAFLLSLPEAKVRTLTTFEQEIIRRIKNEGHVSFGEVPTPTP